MTNHSPIRSPSPISRRNPASLRFPRAAGFTLIELLVVIGIIAVLAALFVPAMFRARIQAAVTAQKMDFQIIGSALEQYKSDFNTYPLDSGFTSASGYGFPIGPLAAALLGPGPAATNQTTGYNGDGNDGPGFRALGRKVWGPYLPVDKFSMVWYTNGDKTQSNVPLQVPLILDHWGNPIEYLPVYNPPVPGRPIMGVAYSGGSATLGPQAIFDCRDSVVIANPYASPLPNPGLLGALEYKLGNLSATGTIAPGETLVPLPGYLLISSGPDGRFTDLTNVPQSNWPQTIAKADDVYNVGD